MSTQVNNRVVFTILKVTVAQGTWLLRGITTSHSVTSAQSRNTRNRSVGGSNHLCVYREATAGCILQTKSHDNKKSSSCNSNSHPNLSRL